MNKNFDNWQAVIVDFFERRKNSETEKYIKEKIKEMDSQFKKNKYFNDQKLEDYFNTKKNKPKPQQSTLQFQKEKLGYILSLNVELEDFSVEEMRMIYQKKFEEIETKYQPNVWLNNNANNAKNISFATHVPKLTHSKIDSSSFYDAVHSKKNNLLTTSSLESKDIDGAVAGNQYAPIFQFLELKFNNEKLASKLDDVNNNILDSFTENNNELSKWKNYFKKSSSAIQINAHLLLKQIYFPTNDKDYCLLCNVKSSSMAHRVYTNVSPNQDIKIASKYSKTLVTDFPNTSKLSVTASNPSNASQLNAKRGGKIILFSTQPPVWQSKLKPPGNKKSMFDSYYYSKNTSDNIKYLVDFLLRNEVIDLSIRNPEKQKWLEKWLEYIIDDFLFFVASIHILASGWSSEKGVKLKAEHQYLLDPYNKNKEFQVKRKDSDWQKVVVNDFSTWLNRQLINKDKKFTLQKEYSRIWKKIMTKELRKYNQIIEVGINEVNT